MDLWEQDDVDLVAPGFIEFGMDRRGSLGFIAVQGGIDWRVAPRNGRQALSSRGKASMKVIPSRAAAGPWSKEDGSLRGHIYFHLGDDSGFRAERMEASSRSRGRAYGC